MSTPAATDSSPSDCVVPRKYLYPFALVTSLFALWGFANDITNPLVKAFKDIFLISNAQSSLVQTAFYGGYATMAIPAALVIRKLSFKSGIVIGLLLYSIGALLFIPASLSMQFNLFLIALYILTFGLAFLETSANPYILSMGPEQTATRRLNLAQAFNPMGSLIAMTVASQLILPSLQISDFRKEQMAAHSEYATMLPGVVDGQTVTPLETDNGFMSVSRKWTPGDKLTAELNFKLAATVQEGVLTSQRGQKGGEAQKWVAFHYGPVTLGQCIESAKEMAAYEPFAGMSDTAAVLAMFEKVPGKKIAFKVKGTDLTLVPYVDAMSRVVPLPQKAKTEGLSTSPRTKGNLPEASGGKCYYKMQ